MSDISFKKFVQFVELDGEPSDEQINEIFGLFRNNAKLDKLKKERERLKGMSAEKKAQLDKALQDFKNGKKTPDSEKIKGAVSNVDWDDALGADDRKYLAKRDRLAMEARIDEVRFSKKKNRMGKWIVCDPEGGDLPGYGVFDTEEEVNAKLKTLNEGKDKEPDGQTEATIVPCGNKFVIKRVNGNWTQYWSRSKVWERNIQQAKLYDSKAQAAQDGSKFVWTKVR